MVSSIRSHRKGFVRYDLHIAVAVVLVVLAIVLPKLIKEGWKSAALTLLAVAGILAGIVLFLMLLVWLLDNVGRPGEGWRGKSFRAFGHLFRFLLCGFVALVVSTAVIAQHHASPMLEAVVPLTLAVPCGLAGAFLYLRLGKDRFWPSFGKLGLALLASLFGGILGILGPEPWAIDAGILAPLLIFAILAVLGRIVPKAGEKTESL